MVFEGLADSFGTVPFQAPDRPVNGPDEHPEPGHRHTDLEKMDLNLKE